MGWIIPYIMENKKCSKPPTRCTYYIYMYIYIYIWCVQWHILLTYPYWIQKCMSWNHVNAHPMLVKHVHLTNHQICMVETWYDRPPNITNRSTIINYHCANVKVRLSYSKNIMVKDCWWYTINYHQLSIIATSVVFWIMHSCTIILFSWTVNYLTNHLQLTHLIGCWQITIPALGALGRQLLGWKIRVKQTR